MDNSLMALPEVDRLASRLQLHELGSIDDAPATLIFDRERSIDLPWAEIAEASGTSETDSIAQSVKTIRGYFQSSWGLEPDVDPETWQCEAIIERGQIVDAMRVVDSDGQPVAAPESLFVSAVTGEALTDGVFLRHGNGQVYRLNDTDALDASHFSTKVKYLDSWSNATGVELAQEIATLTDANEHQTELEVIDLRAPFIEGRYRELMVVGKLASVMRTAAEKRFEDAGAALADPQLLEELGASFLNAEVDLHRVEHELRRLGRQASEMGYVLFVESLAADGAAALPPDGLPAGVVAGKLYRRTTETISWTPFMYVSSWVGWLFPTREVHRQALPTVTYDVDHYEEVDTTVELHTKRASELRSGVPVDAADAEGDAPIDPNEDDELHTLGYQVHVCELLHTGYVTGDGTPLELVMLRCAHDEVLRRRTAVFIPSYDTRLNGQRVVTAYTVFKRPMAGTTPIGFPELGVVESLEYKTSWLRTEVGELVRAINLAPGEKRTITVSRTFDQETSSSTTSSSVFDLTSADSTDLSTEMERTVRNESDVTTKVGAEVSAKGSWGVGSASGSASASKDKTIKQVGTDMAKAAQKAARSVNEQRREEVSSSTTSKTTIHTADTSESSIENINAGRSLNLMFYRLYNRFESRLLLTDLRFKVRSGVELIAGSGILPEKSFSLNEIDAAILELSQTPLPLALDPADRWELKLQILLTVTELLIAEYDDLEADVDSSAGGGSTDLLDTLTSQQEVLTAPVPVVAFGDLTKVLARFENRTLGFGMNAERNADAIEAEYISARTDLTVALAKMHLSGTPVDKTPLLVAAKGLYLDSHVGQLPSTEPYSEAMRQAEIRMRDAEIERVQSEAVRNRALAMHVQNGPLAGTNSTNTILDVDLDVPQQRVSLTLREPLGVGPWHLHHGGKLVALLLPDPQGLMLISHVFGDEALLSVGEIDTTLLELVHAETRSRVGVDISTIPIS